MSGETVRIVRDDVTLRGDPVTGGALAGRDAAERGSIVIDGAHRVVLRDLGGWGITCSGRSYADAGDIFTGNGAGDRSGRGVSEGA